MPNFKPNSQPGLKLGLKLGLYLGDQPANKYMSWANNVRGARRTTNNFQFVRHEKFYKIHECWPIFMIQTSR